MEGLTDEMDIQRGEDGTVVRMRRRLETARR
jgi:hypothetical protein